MKDNLLQGCLASAPAGKTIHFIAFLVPHKIDNLEVVQLLIVPDSVRGCGRGLT